MQDIDHQSAIVHSDRIERSWKLQRRQMRLFNLALCIRAWFARAEDQG